MTIARGDAVALTRALVQIDSRNPDLVPGAPGEAAVARALGDVLRDWGFSVEIVDAAAGRPNVIARIGEGPGRTLMLNGHLDVVGVEGMMHAPFDAELRDGKIFGRGSADMKGGIAAMCAGAARAAAAGIGGEIIIAAVCDEEMASQGTRALIARGVRADAAIVTEPTGLTIASAHKGFVWIEVTVRGRAAHGSRYDIGIDAIRAASRIMVALDAYESSVLAGRRHSLLGRASLHASTIEGGSGWSTYPESCLLRVERRTLPGETPATVAREMHDVCAEAFGEHEGAWFQTQLVVAQEPSDVAADAPVVRALGDAIREGGGEPRITGLSAWTDAALLNAAGIPAICYGPGDISLAHSAEEYVPTREIERATDTLATMIARWCAPHAR